MHQPFDLDWRLRLAAFDSLRRITDTTGGVINRDQLTTGFEFEGQRIAFADRGRGLAPGDPGPRWYGLERVHLGTEARAAAAHRNRPVRGKR